MLGGRAARYESEKGPESMTKTYDQECADLADHFLSDCTPQATPEELEDLAITIQQAIEDWLDLHGKQHG